MKIGIVGLGIIGSGIAKTLLDKGYKVVVFNRTKEKAKKYLEYGAEISKTPKELAQLADIVIVAVWNYDALREITTGNNGIIYGTKKNQIILDFTTQVPKTTLWEKKLYEEKGAHFLETPVHGSKEEANNGKLCILVGGERSVYEKVLPLLKDISKTQYYLGSVGKASATKLCDNLLGVAMICATCEALIFAKKAGLKIKEVGKIWNEIEIKSPLIEGLVSNIINRDFDPVFPIRTMIKDLNLIKEFSEDLGLPLFILPLVHELYKVGANMGLSEENASALIKVYEDFAKVKVKT